MASSLKLTLASATVLSTAVIFKLLSPFIKDVTTSDLLTIWTSLVSWLKPPYLYVVVNCIIITIVASSRLQSTFDDSYPTEPVKVVLPVELPPTHEPAGVLFHGGEPVNNTHITDELRDEDMKIVKENSVDKSVISVELPNPKKPSATKTFSHSKSVPEGSRTLGVTKPKRQDTLDSTWRAITEGRSTPFTRPLRKSDTWETNGDGRQNHNSERVRKSETFEVNRKPPPPQSKLRRSGRLRKEPSLGEEELNRRVEAFIKKFNENMRLQREESLNEYMEMINRGVR